MANFEKAWNITKSWEGAWSAKPEGSDEEKYNGTWWGTNGGATGTYMRDFLGQTWKPADKAKFQRLTLDQVGQTIWKPTRWNWLRGNEIQNQEIANLLFDWGVRRWNSLTVYPIKKNGKVTGYGSGLATALNVPVFSIFQQVTMRKIGGNPPSSTDGFYILTPQAVKLINAHPNPEELFLRLKAIRKQLDNPFTSSIVQRYDSFDFYGTEPKGGVLASRGGGSNTGRYLTQQGIFKPTITGVLYEIVSNFDNVPTAESKYFTSVENTFSKVAGGIVDVSTSNVEYRQIDLNFALQITGGQKVLTPSVILYLNNEATLIEGFKTVAELEQSFRYILKPYETGGNGAEGGTGDGNGLGVRNCNFIDDFIESIGGGKIKQYLYFGAAAYFGFRATGSNNTTNQVINGAAAAGLLYMGLTNPLCNGKK
jgi:hypothetical protein